jgi:hypothetical protein
MSGLGDMDVTPQVQSLERVLTRSSVSSIAQQEYASTLFHLFGLSQNQSSDLPTAPYCRLGDGGEADERYWLQLSPVHLQPDGDGLLLFDTAHLDLSLDEAQQLSALVHEHFRDHNWRLELYDPQRWYLGLKQKPDLQTSPLTDVIGRNINSYLPTGAEAMEWLVILNELQMLLHTSNVNMLRESRGQLPVNGLWMHGGGSHQQIDQTSYVQVSGNDPLVRGMALAAGINPLELPRDSADLITEKDKHLVLYDSLQRPIFDADIYGWIEAVQTFNTWLDSLLSAVRAKNISSVNICPCNGSVYKIDAGSLRRFWKRDKSFIQLATG